MCDFTYFTTMLSLSIFVAVVSIIIKKIKCCNYRKILFGCVIFNGMLILIQIGTYISLIIYTKLE